MSWRADVLRSLDAEIARTAPAEACKWCGGNGELLEEYDEEKFPIYFPCYHCRKYCRSCRKWVSKSELHECRL
jgi:hypothetical protein